MSKAPNTKLRQNPKNEHELSVPEAELKEKWFARKRVKPIAPKVKVKREKDKPTALNPDHPSEGYWFLAMQNAFGTTDLDFASMLMGQLAEAAQFPRIEQISHTTANGVLAAVHGIAPSDETEAMLAVQMVATHQAAMECYRRAMVQEQTLEGRQANLNQGTKLSRTHLALLDALKRHRGKSPQRVVVEHVHVHQGGQAIVGAVDHRGRGSK